MNTSLKWGQLVPLLPAFSSGHESSAHCGVPRATSSDVGHVSGVVRGGGQGVVGGAVTPEAAAPLARREVKDSVTARSVCLCLRMSTYPHTHTMMQTSGTVGRSMHTLLRTRTDGMWGLLHRACTMLGCKCSRVHLLEASTITMTGNGGQGGVGGEGEGRTRHYHHTQLS